MLFNTKAKNPRTAFRGFFYSVLLWRLNPQAGHRLFITIQPFDDVTAGSILLPSFTTPVFLLRLRRLSSTFSVNSHLTVLRHTPKVEAMLAGSTEIQASVHSRKKVYSCLYIHLFHNRPRAQYYTAALRATQPLSGARQCLLLYDSNVRKSENIRTCPFKGCICCRIIYRPQDGNMARLPGFDSL